MHLSLGVHTSAVTTIAPMKRGLKAPDNVPDVIDEARLQSLTR